MAVIPTPKVSVLVPCYRDEKYLDSTLRSIAAQDFLDFEVVVSDEGVDAGCALIGREWAEKDSRFKYFTNVKRLGMTQNWNAARRRALGDYIIKLDGDDEFTPTILGLLVDALDRDQDSNVSACLTQVCNEDMFPREGLFGGRGYALAGLDPNKAQVLNAGRVYPHLFSDVQLWHSCALMFRREALDILDGWDERWGCASDTDIIVRLFESGLKLSHVPTVGVLYRIREGSVSERFRRDTRLQWEGALVHLQSLERWKQEGGSLIKPISIGWYRYWRILEQLLQHGNDGENIDQYRALAKAIAAPPVRVRLIESLRLWLHGIWSRAKAWARTFGEDSR